MERKEGGALGGGIFRLGVTKFDGDEDDVGDGVCGVRYGAESWREDDGVAGGVERCMVDVVRSFDSLVGGLFSGGAVV